MKGWQRMTTLNVTAFTVQKNAVFIFPDRKPGFATKLGQEAFLKNNFVVVSQVIPHLFIF